MRNFLTILSALLFSHFFAACSPVVLVNDVAHQVNYSLRKRYLKMPSSCLICFLSQARTEQTCADPSLTSVFVDAFSPSRSGHNLRPRWVFVVIDSIGNDWQIQGDIFLGWETPQNFTVPFYQLFNSVLNDFVYLPSVNGAVPTASGYVSQGIVGYAYSTQVCGSVPLLSVFQSSTGDHWYTTDQQEHDMMVANGWIDEGTAFFVLPLRKTGLLLEKYTVD